MTGSIRDRIARVLADEGAYCESLCPREPSDPISDCRDCHRILYGYADALLTAFPALATGGSGVSRPSRGPTGGSSGSDAARSREITDEEVEAGARALLAGSETLWGYDWEELSDQSQEMFRDSARDALKAAREVREQ